ncbi:hypothetical protein EJB05_08859, partial [Eragrostis curvula]
MSFYLYGHLGENIKVSFSQSALVDSDGRRVVEHIVLLGHLSQLLGHLSAHVERRGGLRV